MIVRALLLPRTRSSTRCIKCPHRRREYNEITSQEQPIRIIRYFGGLNCTSCNAFDQKSFEFNDNLACSHESNSSVRDSVQSIIPKGFGIVFSLAITVTPRHSPCAALETPDRRTAPPASTETRKRCARQPETNH